MTEANAAFDWKSLSQKTWVVVLAGLLVPPLGMVLAWVKPGWSTRKRLIAAALMGVVLVSWFDKKPRPDESTTPATPATPTTRGASASLSRGWGEGMPEYIKRVVSTTLAESEGDVAGLELKERKETDTRLAYYGEAMLESGRRLQISAVRVGNDFGWVSSKDISWATTDDVRFWNSKGGEISGDDFCTRWMHGQKLLDVRSSWNQQREVAGKRNLERARRAYEGMKKD